MVPLSQVRVRRSRSVRPPCCLQPTRATVGLDTSFPTVPLLSCPRHAGSLRVLPYDAPESNVTTVFRRTAKQQPEPVQVEKPGGKGRPTPTRKEAQAAAKERARMGMDKKSAQKVLRERRAQDNQKVREGMRSGDQRYLMERDKGPVRAFVRDYVDTRISFMEYLLPVLVLIMALQFAGQQQLSSTLWSATILLLVIEVAWLLSRLSKEIRTRFPDEETRGWRFYAMMRAIQLRPLRMPKPRLKPRQPLPKRY